MNTNPSDKQRILILGGRAPVALDLARSFFQNGAVVFVADSIPLYVARASHAVQGTFCIPPPRQQPKAFIEALTGLISEHRITLVIPCCEEVFHVSKHRHLLPENCDVFVDDYQKLLRLHDKFEFITLLKKMGQNAPETINLTSIEDLQGVLQAQESWLLKPRFSRFGDDVIYPHQLAKRAPSLDLKRNWIAQKFLTGRHLSCYSVAHKGHVVAHTNYVCDYRYRGGPSVYFAHEDHVEIERFVADLVTKLDFHGQIAFDFVDTSDGLFPIECNPRSTSGVHILKYSPDFPASFAGKEMPPFNRNRAAMIGIGMAALPLQQLGNKTFLNYLRAILRGRDVVFSVRDPWPFFNLARSLWGFWQVARRNGITLSEAMTIDIAFNEESLTCPLYP